MTPSKLALIIKCSTAINQHRGRTVPAIREGGPFDGRARTEYDPITSFSARCLKPPPCVGIDARDIGVQRANTGGGHDLSVPNSNIEIGTTDDLASWPTRSPVRTGAHTEHAIADPPEYPGLVFADPPDTRPVPVEEYPEEPTQFERDMRRDKGC